MVEEAFPKVPGPFAETDDDEADAPEEQAFEPEDEQPEELEAKEPEQPEVAGEQPVVTHDIVSGNGKEAPVKTSKPDDLPLTPEEALAVIRDNAKRVSNDFWKPIRRTVRSMFEAISTGVNAASDELTGEKKDKS